MERAHQSAIKYSLVISLVLISQVLAAPVESKIREVSLFKNGLGYFQQSVICPDSLDSFSFAPAAAASHGTFWVAYPDQVQLKNLTAKITEIETTRTVTSIAEFLKANTGKQVKLTMGDKTIEGTIKSFTENPEFFEPNPYQPGPVVPTEPYRGGWQPPATVLVIIATETGDVCINPNSLNIVEMVKSSSANSLSTKSKSMLLDVNLAKPAGGKEISISYLAKGITWAPSYMIDISDSKNAHLSCKAVVINEAADLDNATLQLVTGFPNLQFADIVSPLAMKEKLAQFLQSLNQGESQRGNHGRFANVMSQSAHYAGDMYTEMSALLPEYGAAKQGMAAEDLFFYPIEKVTLGRNQTGYYPLFTESVTYEHIYKWDIPDYVNEEDRYYYDRPERQREQDDKELVWHCVRLENKTIVPWTTAPAEIVKDSMILGQDTLKYTPVKGKNDVRITQAVNVRAEQTENETARQRDALQMYGNHFDLITVEGNMSLTNFQDKPIKIDITKVLSGEVKTSEPQAEIVSLAKGLKKMNPTRKLNWTIELEPQQSIRITYSYEVYVRR